MIERITILGGSSVYTPELIQSIITHNLRVKEVVLFGREGTKLPLVTSFCQRLAKRSGYPIEIVASTDLEEAVSGAAYVLNHIRVGGMRARMRDEKLPPKLGIVGDESVGAGGVANALRTLPVVLDYARRIEKVNPDCTFINLTNPMGVVVEALIRNSKLRVVGVCDLPGEYIKKVAKVLERSAADLSVDYIGLNHFGWIQDVRVDGASCMDTVLDRLEENRSDGFDYDLIELFRLIPTSTAGLFFHQDTILKQQQSCGRFRGEVLHEAEQQILKTYEDTRLSEIPELTRARNAVWYDETIVPLMLALECEEEQELVLCMRNDGAIRDLPDACSVEVPVRVSSKGMKPKKVGSCPHFLRGLFHSVKQSDRLTVEAVRHKSYELALQALTIHPMVPSVDSARRFLDGIVKGEKLRLH